MHKPVLVKEVLEGLDLKSGDNVVDATFGGGGHSAVLFDVIKPSGKLCGVDFDRTEAVEDFEKKYKNNFIFVNDNFANIEKIYEHEFGYPIAGILCDLGISSIELDDPGRGFSFRGDGPLDMRMGQSSQRLTASEVLNKYSTRRIKEIFMEYGEVGERTAKRMANEIIKRRGSRPFEKTIDLVETVLKVVYEKAWENGDITVETKEFYKNGHRVTHPATRFFQALRIEVNKEIDNLESFLEGSKKVIKPGGRIAIISFHSIEDRMVKRAFREWARDGEFELVNKKPIGPSEEEVGENVRARSAKLRVVRRID